MKSKKIRQIIQRYLPNTAYALENRTDRDRVLSLIELLTPVSVGRDLIRLGPDGDGGYLIPYDLEGIATCFSPGIGPTSGFEEDCLKRGMKVFLADKSVDRPHLDDHYDLDFTKKFIGSVVDEDTMTLDHWADTSDIDSSSDLMLQMDIEGHEYASILSLSPALLNRFRIIVIEFHNLQRIWNKEFHLLALSVFQKIANNHTCVHIHPNDCCGIYKRSGIEIPRIAEFTFIRNDRVIHKKSRNDFPHPLDFDNNEGPAITLPKHWYNS